MADTLFIIVVKNWKRMFNWIGMKSLNRTTLLKIEQESIYLNRSKLVGNLSRLLIIEYIIVILWYVLYFMNFFYF